MVSIHIEPDEGYDHIYTNGNCVNGVARLYFDVATAIDSVSIKLEGFSRTTVRNTDGKPYTEHHRLVYETQTLLSPPESGIQTFSKPTEYRFSLRFPDLNECCQPTKRTLFTSRNATTSSHVRGALPPSCGGSNRDIAYFLKVTVDRHGFLKRKYRERQDVLFSPTPSNDIYGETGGEVCATRPGLLPSAHTDDTEPLRFDAKFSLPNPAILICDEELPFHLSVQKFNNSNDCLFLDALRIRLIGTTTLKAQHLTTCDEFEHELLDLHGMAKMVISGESPADTIGKVSSAFWKDITISSYDLAPSFATCNMSRAYEVVVDMCFKAGRPRNIRSDSVIKSLSHRVMLVFQGPYSEDSEANDAKTSSSQSLSASPLMDAEPISEVEAESEEEEEEEEEDSEADTESQEESESEEDSGETTSSSEVHQQAFIPEHDISAQSGVDQDDGAPPTYEDVMNQVTESILRAELGEGDHEYPNDHHYTPPYIDQRVPRSNTHCSNATSIRSPSNLSSPINSPRDSAFSPHSPNTNASQVPSGSAEARARQIEEDRKLAELLSRE